MSFDTDPSLYGFAPVGIECTFAYPSGETPDKLILSLSDIITNPSWVPSNGLPPNGDWTLDYIGGCEWKLISGKFTFRYLFSGGNSLLDITNSDIGVVFTVQRSGGVFQHFLNPFITPTGHVFYMGEAFVTSPADTGPNSTQDLMSKVALEPAAGMYAQSFPQPGDFTTSRYSARDGETNVLVQYELPE